MRRTAQWRYLARHLYLLWRTGQLRFRLETFGLYYPAPPYSVPFWQAPRRNCLLLLERSVAYGRWVVELEEIRRGGAGAWWQSHGGRRSRDIDDRQ